jgi:hypothetical protein
VAIDTQSKSNPLIDAISQMPTSMDSGMGSGAIPSANSNPLEAEITAVSDALEAVRGGDPTNLEAELTALEEAVAALRQAVQP